MNTPTTWGGASSRAAAGKRSGSFGSSHSLDSAVFRRTLEQRISERLEQSAIMSDTSMREFLDSVRRYVLDTQARSEMRWDIVRPVLETAELSEKPPPSEFDDDCGGWGDEAEAASAEPTSMPEPQQHCSRCLLHSAIPPCPDDMNLTHELLNKLAILKLNGGLGTTMGCHGPKSAIEVRGGLTFLDLTVRQIEFLNSKYGVDVPLILMNSFSTIEETERVVTKYDGHNLQIHTVTQHCFPLICRQTLTPVPTEILSGENRQDWYPPGHGDVYATLAYSGLLENLVNQGKEYIFISNIDNLGATADLGMLYHIMCHDHEFCLEVTERQRQDVEGGIIVDYGGELRLLEHAYVPLKHEARFRDYKQYRMFNTNNIWANLRAMQRLVSVQGLKPEIYVKEVIRSDAGGDGVGRTDIKLMSTAGSAVSPPVPTVKLGPRFQRVDEYISRFPQVRFGVPNVLELEHLTVSGSVTFGQNVTLKGTVIIVVEEGSHIDIASGSVLEDNVLTGNLRILEH